MDGFLTKIDWLMIVSCFLLSISIGIFMAKRAGKRKIKGFRPAL